MKDLRSGSSPRYEAASLLDGPPLAGARLEVVVIHTGVKQTLAALRAAGTLARGLDAAIHVLAPRIVPYPLPLERPPVARDFTERRFRTLLPDCSVDTKMSICLCRDKSALLDALPPRSIVVVGIGKRWWPSPERRMARLLRRRGHHVIVAECR